MKTSRSYSLQPVRLLLGTIALLSLTGCSDTDSLLPEANKQTVLQIGQLSIANEPSSAPETRATSQWSWANGDLIVAAAGSGYSATYIYNSTGSTWSTTSTEFTKEHVGITPITLKYGETTPYVNQSTDANYRRSDFIQATNIKPDHITINATLAHQQTDVVIKIVQGDKWTSTTEFNATMADASLKLNSNNTPYRPSAEAGKEYRCILPPATVANLLGSGKTLATFTFGSNTGTPEKLRGRTARIAVPTTLTAANLKGKRYTVTVTFSMTVEISISAGLSGWDENTPADLFPVE